MSLFKKTYQSYTIGLSVNASNHRLKKLADLFNRDPGESDGVLGGRGSIGLADVEGFGRVAVKQYLRGGVIRFYNKNRYLRCGKTRGHLEFETLEKVRQIGVNAPEPLVYAYQGFPFYRAWLITREIESHQTLADLALSDIKQACAVMKNVIEQLSLLIHHRILHVDMHPGNVVIGKSGDVYLVDFDKARAWKKTEEKLIQRYKARWKRAVVKHKLPYELVEMLGLSQKETL